MKIGDLVELSAKGAQLKYCKEFLGLVGVISGLGARGNENRYSSLQQGTGQGSSR